MSNSVFSVGDLVTWGDGSIVAKVISVYKHRATCEWVCEAVYKNHRNMPSTRVMPMMAFRLVV